MAIQYIIYTDYWQNGRSQSPQQAIKASGARFSGGLWTMGPRQFGYLEGTPEQIEQAVALLKQFSIRPLRPSEALRWVESACPTNSTGCDGGYIGPPHIDSQTGRITRAWATVPFEHAVQRAA
ncbi:MAG: hypothetical protein GYB68_14365 [Chloroflexi bacterium]|nr:hypothetical protein [Chloroflexota bacterium]